MTCESVANHFQEKFRNRKVKIVYVKKKIVYSLMKKALWKIENLISTSYFFIRHRQKFSGYFVYIIILTTTFETLNFLEHLPRALINVEYKIQCFSGGFYYGVLNGRSVEICSLGAHERSRDDYTNFARHKYRD